MQEFQQVLTDFQGCEEQLVSEAQDGMRKHVVFESSTLANQQYDLQMLFKVRSPPTTTQESRSLRADFFFLQSLRPGNTSYNTTITLMRSTSRSCLQRTPTFFFISKYVYCFYGFILARQLARNAGTIVSFLRRFGVLCCMSCDDVIASI